MPRSCVSCGAEVPEEGRYCHVCGAPLWIACPGCGAEQHASAAFCSDCGTALRRDAAATPSRHEERRVVTILFADLAGSTALGERLDPEDVRALQGELFELVNSEVERFGGVTEKFVGDAILAVFGAPQTHEDDAERAVRAAIAVRDEFPAFAARFDARHGGRLGIRIGIDTGEVISGRDAVARGELMVTGDSVNVAARLQQLAEPGTVLVGDRTRLATQRAVLYGDRAELDAKGKQAPVGAWQALSVREGGAGRERPRRTPFVGRDDELALLRLTASRVERERVAQLVTVFGHAGVGKSRLVSEFLDRLGEAGVAVGRCVPYGDGITYLPLAEAASSLAGIHDDDPLEIAVAKLRASVERIVAPEHVEAVVDPLAWTLGLSLPGRTTGIADAGNVRGAVQRAWTVYLQALGCDELFVLVIEDIHWASETLLDLLEDVAGALEDTSVLILCPSRPELVESRPSWGTGRLRFSSLALSPLGSDAVEALLHALVGADEVAEHVARAILDPAEGNPFFVEELFAMLVEQGVLEKRNGAWTATEHLGSVQVPDSIHGVIAARIDLLQAADRDALRRCSVMGRVFWPSAVGVDADIVAGLGRGGIAVEHPDSSFSGLREFAFKHALTHDVVYATLPRGERRALHRRVADWLSETVPDRQAEAMELVAYHYEQALAYGEPDESLAELACEALLGAGEAAVRRGAYAAAETLLGRALDIAASDVTRARGLVLAARGDVANARWDRARARLQEAIEIADRHGDTPMRADALGWKARVAWLGGRWREALESAEGAVAALEGLPESAELAWALSRLSQIRMLRGLRAAEETALRAIEVARRTAEPGAEANARINLFSARGSAGVMPSAHEVREIIRLAQAGGVHDESVRAVVNYLWSGWLFTSPEDLEREIDSLLAEVGPGLATESYREYLQLSRAALLYIPAGRWSTAESAVETPLEPTASASGRIMWLWVLTGLALRRGDLELVDRHLPEFRGMALASKEPQRIIPLASVAMPRSLLAGDAEDVRALADTVAALPAQAVTAAATLTVCRALAAAGERERLARLVASFGEPAVGLPQVVRRAGRGLVQLLEGDPEGALGMLGSAEAELRAFDRGYEAACLALEVARAEEARGNDAGAKVARARAEGVLAALGCVNPY